MPQDDLCTLRECRRRQLLPRTQPVNDLWKNPRIPLRATTNHHRICTCDVERTRKISRTSDVTAHNHGNLDGTLHLGNRRIVRIATVELLARAPVYGNGIDTDRLRHPCNLHGIARGIIPTEPHLHREWQLRCPTDCCEYLLRLFRLAHQCRALTILHDLRRRTPHVEVQNIRCPDLLDVGGSLRRHRRRFGKNLHRNRALARLRTKHLHRMLVAVVDALTAHHLRKRERTAHIVCDHAIRCVRHPRHRCEKDRIIERECSYFHWLHGWFRS